MIISYYIYSDWPANPGQHNDERQALLSLETKLEPIIDRAFDWLVHSLVYLLCFLFALVITVVVSGYVSLLNAETYCECPVRRLALARNQMDDYRLWIYGAAVLVSVPVFWFVRTFFNRRITLVLILAVLAGAFAFFGFDFAFKIPEWQSAYTGYRLAFLVTPELRDGLFQDFLGILTRWKFLFGSMVFLIAYPLLYRLSANWQWFNTRPPEIPEDTE